MIKGGPLHDDRGRPLVFSAREVSPSEDNPLWLHERLGERLFWLSLPNGGRLPRNVRHSVLLFYLLGRGRGRWWDALIIPLLPLLIVCGIDLYTLVWSMRGGWLPSVGETVFIALSSPILIGLYAQWIAHRTFQRVEGRISIESLALTRIRPADIVYALAAWPALHLHLANGAMLMCAVVGVAISIGDALRLAPTVGFFNEAAFVGTILVGLCLARWLLFTLAINIAVATVVRSRLMIRNATAAAWRAARELITTTGVFFTLTLMFPFLVLGLGMVAGCLGVVLVAPVLLMVWVASFRSAAGRAASILSGVMHNWRAWWMCSGLERPADKSVLTDDW